MTTAQESSMPQHRDHGKPWCRQGLSPLTVSPTTEIMDWQPGTFSAFTTPSPPNPSPVAQLVKNLPTMQETWVRSPGEGKGYPLQYSGLENSMDCIVHEIAKSWTQLRDFHFQFHI